MADSVLTVFPSDETLRRLTAAAEAAGVSVEAYAAQILDHALAADGVNEDAAVFQSAHDWTEAGRRLAEYDRTSEYITLKDWEADFRADVEARLSARP
jgi:plasmid stability protein